MSNSQMPARPATRIALFLSLFLCLAAPLGLIGVGAVWLSTANRPQQPLAIQATPVVAVERSLPASIGPPSAPMAAEHTPAAEKPTLVGAQIEKMVTRSQGRSADKNLSELDTMSQQLKSVSSEESVDDLANNVQRWMGLESRASSAKAAVRIEEFDIDSAQLHDVRRSQRRPGQVEYTAVLIDARGHTLDIKMTEAEGREVHSLMERIKANPLLEKVYRRIAMPLLDSLVQSARDKVKQQK